MARKNVTKVFEAFMAGKTSGNLGDSISCQVCETSKVIYSYRMPIAHSAFNRVVKLVDKAASPSVTTSGHINGVRALAEENGFNVVVGLNE